MCVIHNTSLLGGSTGTHSYHTVEYGKEIMFHVSTLLPFSKDNQQQASEGVAGERR
jgi:hypothetical protein